MDAPAIFSPAGGAVVAFSTPRPRSLALGTGKPERGRNQDAALLHELDDALVLAVADGMGGARGGARAATLAVETLRDTLEAPGAATLRERILEGFDRANHAVRRMRVGAGATLVVAAIVDGAVRLFHAGDAQALVVGQRGTIKALTRSHSPVGFAVAAGVLDFDEALHHPALHLVANGLGNPELTVEVSSPLKLAARDTLLLASDGLFDNLYLQEVVELIRRGALPKVGRALVEQVGERMALAFELTPFDASPLIATAEPDHIEPDRESSVEPERESPIEPTASSVEPPGSPVSEAPAAGSGPASKEEQEGPMRALDPPAPLEVIEEADEPIISLISEEAASSPIALPSKPDDLTFLLYRQAKR